MARILIVHPGVPFSQHDVWAGWEKAFRRQGHHVQTYRLDERLRMYGKVVPELLAIEQARLGIFAQAFLMWPELVFFIGTSFIDEKVLIALRGRGLKIAALFTESPYEDTRQLALASYTDVNFISDPLNLDAWKEHGPVLCISTAFDPEVHHPGDAPKEVDLAFIGTALAHRQEFFGQMNLDGLCAVIDGGGWPHVPHDAVFNEDAADLYRHSRTGINVYRRDGDTIEGITIGPRECEMAACGLPFARDPRPESDALFPFLPSFSTPGEAREVVDWLLADEDRRQALGKQVMQAIQGRTFDNQAAQAMRFIEEIL
jgi:hypothetical protein